MAWAAPIIHAVGDILTASDWNISSNDLTFLSGTKGATIGTSQSTTSTTFADLATTGPAVTVITGANAVVMLAAFLNINSVGQAAEMGVAVSGATTIAASAASLSPLINEQTQNMGGGTTFTVTGLTPGSNTFTAKYLASAGTATFASRSITVIPLP